MNDRAETVSSDDPLRTIPPGPESPPQQPPAEANLPGYEILNELGRGGMGVVYKARQTGLNRIVAVKMILGGSHAGPDERVRFRHEAETLARCQHPNIVQIHDVGTHGDRIYLALEFIDGPTLAQRCGFTPQAPKWSAELVVVLARAVHHAHQQGVVHRDLKPANVLLTADGTPKVTDFGLARRVEGGSGMTHTGTVMGTPSYMPPEQAAGQTKDVGPAADVYALGAILYELLTGRPPFLAQTPYETLTQVIGDDPVPPRRLQTRVPRDLETICLKSLHKLPRRRYDSAAELADDLQRFLAGEPIRGRPSGPAERALKWARRRPAQAVGLVMGLLLLLVLAGGGLWAARQEQAQAERERGLRAEAQKGLYDANILLAREAWERADIARVLHLLGESAPRPGEDDLRGPEWYFLKRLCHGELFRMDGEAGNVFCLASSPDGKTLATGNTHGEVMLWDVASRQAVATLAAHEGNIRFVTFSPDGSQLATGGVDGCVRLWDVARRFEPCTLRGHGGTVFAGAFSPDGGLLVTAGQGGKVIFWDARDGSFKHERTSLDPRSLSLALSPDGTLLATGGGDRKVRLWDVASGRHLFTLVGHEGPVWQLAFCRNGDEGKLRLISGSFDATLRVWDPDDGRLLTTLAGHTNWIEGLAVSPDGRNIASGGADRTVKLWDLETGLERATLKGHTDRVRGLAFSPDRQTLYTAGQDGLVKAWRSSAGRARVTLRAGREMVRSVALTPDGRTLAGTGDDASVHLWDTATGRRLVTVPVPPNDVRFLAFHGQPPLLAVAGFTKFVQFWKVDEAAVPARQVGPASCGVFSFTVTPDGRWLVTGGDRSPGPVEMLSLEDPAVRPVELAGHETSVTWAAVSPDGRTLATASRDGTARLWDLGPPGPRHTLAGHTAEVRWVGFHPDGRTVVTVSLDATVRLWDAATGRQVAELRGATGPIWCAAFTPDGKILITGGGERTRAGEVKLWDVDGRRELANLPGHSAGITSLVVSGDGQTLVTADAVGVIKIWDLPRLLDGL